MIPPQTPKTLSDVLPSHYSQLLVLLQLSDDVQRLRLVQISMILLLFMLKVLVSTTTMTETISTPQLTQSAPISLPTGVLGVQSPQPTEVMVMTVIQAMSLYMVKLETEQIWYSAILNRKEKMRTLVMKVAVMKVKGESLKIERRQKMAPDFAPYILQMRSARGDIQRLLMKQEATKKQLLKMANMIIRQLSLKVQSFSTQAMGEAVVGYCMSIKTWSRKGQGMIRMSIILIRVELKESLERFATSPYSALQTAPKMSWTINIPPTTKDMQLQKPVYALLMTSSQNCANPRLTQMCSSSNSSTSIIPNPNQMTSTRLKYLLAAQPQLIAFTFGKMGGSVRPVISLANRCTSAGSLIEIPEMEAVKIIVSRPSKDHLEDFVGIDLCLAWGAWQSWPEEVAHVVAAGVVEGVADAEVAEGLAGRPIDPELLVAEDEVHLVVEHCGLATGDCVGPAVGQGNEPASLLLPQVRRERALGDAGEVVLSVFLLVLDDDDEGRVVVHEGMQVARMVLLQAEEQLGSFDWGVEPLFDELRESFLVVLETHQHVAFEEFGRSRNQVLFFLFQLSDLLLEGDDFLEALLVLSLQLIKLFLELGIVFFFLALRWRWFHYFRRLWLLWLFFDWNWRHLLSNRLLLLYVLFLSKVLIFAFCGRASGLSHFL